MSPIINLQRRLAETGRIRIGQSVSGVSKNGKAYTAPKKLETFRLTSTSEKAIIAVAAKYGGTPQVWADAPVGKQWELFTESSTLDVLIPPEAMSYSVYYELWSGGGCTRRCNGSYQIPGEEDCVCDPDNRECKPHTRISLMLADLPGAGLWRLDTQGYYAATEIGGAFELAQLISNATGRAIVPGVLRLDQREVKRPDQPTRKFAVPVLDFDVDMNALARGSQPTLSSGVTPVPDLEPTRTLAEELEAVNTPVEKPKRSNAAEPVRSTGIKPRARGSVDENGERQYSDDPFPQPEQVVMANETQVTAIHNSLTMLEETDKEMVKELWTKANIPKVRLGDLTSAQADKALELILGVLNAVDTSDAPEDESGENDHTEASGAIVNGSQIETPMITNPQIGKIRVMVGNAGVDKADIHNHVSDILHRQIGSLKELTKSEAHKVIDQLKEDAGE